MSRKMIIAAGLVLICAAALAVWYGMSGTEYDNPVAEVYLGGELYRRVPLSSDTEFTVETPNGWNTIRVENGAVSVVSADCPDGVCVKTGAVRGAVPIVCLPHRLEIRVVGGDSDVDAVAG